jgi:hypothetical protein
MPCEFLLMRRTNQRFLLHRNTSFTCRPSMRSKWGARIIWSRISRSAPLFPKQAINTRDKPGHDERCGKPLSSRASEHKRSETRDPYAVSYRDAAAYGSPLFTYALRAFARGRQRNLLRLPRRTRLRSSEGAVLDGGLWDGGEIGSQGWDRLWFFALAPLKPEWSRTDRLPF